MVYSYNLHEKISNQYNNLLDLKIRFLSNMSILTFEKLSLNIFCLHVKRIYGYLSIVDAKWKMLSKF